jgi:GTP-binding protein
MFVDEITIEISAGNGGNGAVSFRKEKYVPHGGPSGGDGGRGGDIILEADSNLSTLLDFRYQRKYEAVRGEHGAYKDMHGRDSADLVLKVPVGTIATDEETGQVLADLTRHGERRIVAKGGSGGRGNAHFATSTQQAPKFSENGEPGEHRKVKLELKLLADVGLIGFPNVGKSTLIAAISAARPKIADYPFTTLVPNLGVVRVSQERTFVVADIPGLIEGASEGAGLGHQFLRHVERTRVLVHLVDISETTGRDPREDFETVNNELRLYSPRLMELPQIVAFSKIDVGGQERVQEFKEYFTKLGHEVFPISAVTHEGLPPLIYKIDEELRAAPAVEVVPVDDIVRITPGSKGVRARERQWHIVHDPASGAYVVQGKGMERFVAMTNMDNEDALRRMQRTMERTGVFNKLKALGVKEGDTVRIGEVEFNYVDEDRENEELEEEAREEELDAA